MTTDGTDLYALLGVPRQATAQQIRRAYRALVRENHPDTRAPAARADAAASNAALERAVAAYAVLGDAVRRARYDERTAREPSRARRPAPSPWPHPWYPTAQPPMQTGQPQTQAGQPPIRVGPVRWHRTR